MFRRFSPVQKQVHIRLLAKLAKIANNGKLFAKSEGLLKLTVDLLQVYNIAIHTSSFYGGSDDKTTVLHHC